MRILRLSLLLLLCAFPLLAFGQHSVQLTWTDAVNTPPPATTYSAYRGSGACSTNPAMTSIKTDITALTYTDAGLEVGKYCYYVTAVDAASLLESAPSNTADAKILPHPPVLGAAQQLSTIFYLDVEVKDNPDSL